MSLLILHLMVRPWPDSKALHLTLGATLSEKALFIKFRSLFLDYNGKCSSRKWEYSSHKAEIFLQTMKCKSRAVPTKAKAPINYPRVNQLPKEIYIPNESDGTHSTLRSIFPGRLLKDNEIEQLRDGGSKGMYFNRNRITHQSKGILSKKEVQDLFGQR